MFQAWCARRVTQQQWRMDAYGDMTITQSKNEPACLRATFIRDEMTVEPGDAILIRNGDSGAVNLFYGYVESTAKHDNKVDVVAYDQLYFMKVDQLTHVYGDIKASDLFIDMAKQLNLSFDPSGVEDTEYPVPGVIADGVHPLDIINEALNVTYTVNKKKFFMWDDCYDLRLASEDSLKIDPTQFKITFDNTKSMSYTEDASEMINYIVVYKDRDNNFDMLSSAVDQDKVDRYKRRTTFHKVNSEENTQVIADNMLNEHKELKRTMSVTLFGDSVYIMPGRTIEVDYYHFNEESTIAEFIWGDFMIDSVTHNLSGGTATMDLELTLKEMHAFV